MANPARTWSKQLAIAIIAIVASSPPLSAKLSKLSDLCEDAALHQERLHRIPSQLLHAIAIAESGRWNKKQKENAAWPWTVTSGGKGRYFGTKNAAIRAVKRLQSRGVRNIDVGCMQVNLRYHPNAFNSLNEAFDPISNARYAAEFLARLRQEKRSWVQAVKHYHSATRELHTPYRTKVYKIWRAERRKVRNQQIAKERQIRRRNAARYSRVDRILAQNSAAERRFLWLDRTTRRLLGN